MTTSSRRGAFRALLRLFSGRSAGPYFLGIQLVINTFGEDHLRARLVEALAAERVQNETPEEKGRFIRRVVALLLEFEPFWSYGYWDYVDDESERAVSEYEGWVREIQAGLATMEDEVGEEPDGLHRTSADRQYVAVSLLFLLDDPFPPGEVKDEDAWFKRATFAKLTNGLLRIDPRRLQADAAFIVPGNPDDGLSEDDLLSEDWSYLRELWG